MLESLIFHALNLMGQEKISVKVSDGIVSAESLVNDTEKSGVTIFELNDDTAKWLAEFDALNIQDWSYEYKPDYIIFDGDYWVLEYVTQGGDPRKISGESMYPDNWDDFLNWLSRVAPHLKPEIEDGFELVCSDAENKEAEVLTLDSSESALSFERRIDGVTKKSFKYNLDANELDNILYELSLLDIDINDDAGLDARDGKIIFYKFIIKYRYGQPEKVFNGVYDIDFLPDSWEDFLEAVNDNSDILSSSNIIAIAIADILNQRPQEPEYIYCSVAFSDDGCDGQTWYYIAGDKTIKPGDCVAVPWGKLDKKRFGIIKKVEIFKKSEVPFDLNRTKFILYRASREEFEQDMHDTLSYEFQKLMKNFEWRQNEFIADRLADFKYALKKLGYDSPEYLKLTKGRKLDYEIKDINIMTLKECCAWLSWIMWGENFHTGVFKEYLYKGFIDILLKRICELLGKR